MHYCKHNNISCAFLCGCMYYIIYCDLSGFANYSVNATLAHPRVGSTLYHIGSFTNCFLTMFLVVYLCSMLCLYNIKFQCTAWLLFLLLCLPVKLPCLCMYPYVSFTPAHTLLLMLAYTCPMSRLQHCCMHLVACDAVVVIFIIVTNSPWIPLALKVSHFDTPSPYILTVTILLCRKWMLSRICWLK